MNPKKKPRRCRGLGLDLAISRFTNSLGQACQEKRFQGQLPQELWAAERVWVPRGSHLPPLYDGPYTVLQRSICHIRLKMGAKEDNISTSRLKPCTSGSSTLTAAQPAPAGAAA
jgi:hypothetical protein